MEREKGFTCTKIMRTFIQDRVRWLRSSDARVSARKKIFLGGFTLIELLVVIAIIGLLSSVVMASLNTSRIKARDSKRIQDLRQLQTALVLYYDDNTSYPNALSDLVPNYIRVLPVPPPGTTQSNYAYARYGTYPSVTYYHLGAVLEDSTSVSKLPARQCRSGTAGTVAQCVSGSNATSGSFNGATVGCTNVANSAPVFCYDVTP